jgi:hypothetical protein
VFDTETTTSLGQALLFGCARVYRWDRQALFLREESFFYADDLPIRDAPGYRVLAQEAERAGIPLRSRRAFVNEVFWPVAYKGRAWVVGFNVPFDLARLSVGWGTARIEHGGGFSLVLWDYEDAASGERLEHRFRPRVRILHIDSKRSLISFTRRLSPDAVDLIPEDSASREPDAGYRFTGHFLDLRALTFALTNRGHSLASACEAFGVEHGKEAAAGHGQITPEHVGYCRRDVLATSELLERTIEEYERHPIALSPPKALSPAAIAKAYLDEMGIQAPLARQPHFPRSVLGSGMAAYIGGRVDVRVRLQPMPVVLLDFRSMYPTVNALMGLWRFMIAERIDTVDATDDTRRLVDELTPEACIQPETWRDLVVLCRVRPASEVLPARARYGGAAWQVGINPLTTDEPVWLPLPDVVAAKLPGGRAPEILEAVRLVPVGLQQRLQPVRLGGDIDIDPYDHDFFASLVEERARLETRQDLDLPTRARLKDALKSVANSGSYGINAELTRHELGPRGEPVTVYALNDPFTAHLTSVEDPGRYCFPPLAACTTGAARLMLALLERCVTNAGGTAVFGDTDSMAVVASKRGGLVPCPGGPHTLDGAPAVRALNRATVDAIAGQFARLSPHDRDAIPGSILKIEDVNYAPTGEQRQLYALAVSAKRSCLFTLDNRGEPTLVKWSEHGLGHLLNPIDPESSDRDWIRQIWEVLVNRALGRPAVEPAWLDRPALTKLAVTSPNLLRPFERYNQARLTAEQIRPFSFFMYAQVAPFGHPAGVDPARFRLVAPFEADPKRWDTLEWIDLYSGRTYPIVAAGHPSPDAVRIKTYRDVLDLYGRHPEPKSIDHTGRPCSRASTGLLTRRPITASHICLIGKESNNLEHREAGLVGDLDLVLSTYDDPALDPWRTLVLPILAHFPTRRVAECAQIDRRTVQRILRGTRPRRNLATRLTLIARDLAHGELEAQGIQPPTDRAACLRCFLDGQANTPTYGACAVCGAPVHDPRALYCSSRCKKRAYRRRRRTAGVLVGQVGESCADSI